jgi:alginate O-acetyltransferase complex protein AlgI
MLFNSPIFYCFFAIVLALYMLLRGDAARKWMLLIASYAFYANWDWRYLFLLLFSTATDWLIGRRIHASQVESARKAWLTCSVVLNLGVLATFKYGRLFTKSLGFELEFLPNQIPIGISFYTLQALSYTIDIYRRGTEPCRSLRDFALFVAFFGQLVSGPIVRSVEFLPQIKRMHDLRLDDFTAGFQRFVCGLFKKVILADHASLFMTGVFANPTQHDALTLWLATHAFYLYIYCDFSAYTDMAIGICRVFGIAIPENFDRPFLSRSITEFWRRWHLTLSRWLRDYLFIPLGGSRNGPGRTYVNLLIVMGLGGLWHGSTWNFLLWGLFHGVFLCLERLLGFRRDKVPDDERWTVLGWLQLLFMFHLLSFSWVLVKCHDLEKAKLFFAGMFTQWDLPGDPAVRSEALLWTGVLAAYTVYHYFDRSRRFGVSLWPRLPAAVQGLALGAVLVATSLLFLDQIDFFYFQF